LPLRLRDTCAAAITTAITSSPDYSQAGWLDQEVRREKDVRSARWGGDFSV